MRPKMSLRYVGVGLIATVCINFVVFHKLSKSNSEILHTGVFRQQTTHFLEHSFHSQNLTRKTSAVKSAATCPGLSTGELSEDGKFQAVNELKIYVYSAFLDKDVVRIIALRQRLATSNSLMCQLRFNLNGQESVFLASAKVDNLPEDHDRSFVAAFILCQIPSELPREVLHSVSVVSGNPCKEASNILGLHNSGRTTAQFTVCVTPLNFRYNKTHELVEMIEMNKLLGAEKFIFYNYSTAPNIDKILHIYSQRGEVEVRPWKLPMKTDTWPPSGSPEIHYFGQIASLNDCLYRYRNQSKYLVYEDLDEFIIPRLHDTWAELVHEREQLHRAVSAFSFKCVFFRKEWKRPYQQFRTAAMKYKSVILTHTQKEMKYFRHGIRSKLIINPSLTVSVGVHQVWQTSGSVDLVSEHIASLHHYRSWDLPDDPQPKVKDEIVADKYGALLVQKLDQVWSELDNMFHGQHTQ